MYTKDYDQSFSYRPWLAPRTHRHDQQSHISLGFVLPSDRQRITLHRSRDIEPDRLDPVGEGRKNGQESRGEEERGRSRHVGR